MELKGAPVHVQMTSDPVKCGLVRWNRKEWDRSKREKGGVIKVKWS